MIFTSETINSSAETWWPYVFHVFWQTAVVAAIVLAIAHFGRRIPSTIRSALVLVAFAKFLIPPVLPFPSGVFSQMNFRDQTAVAVEDPATATHQSDSLSDPISSNRILVAENRPGLDHRAGQESENPAMMTGDSPISNSAASSAVPTIEPAGAVIPPRLTWQSWLMLLHGLGVLLVTGWIVLAAIRLQRLKRSARTVETGRVHEVFSLVARELGIQRTIRLRVSQYDVPPMAFGILHPIVLLPASLVDELNSEELQTICAHELAHHKRRDPLMNFVQAAILAVWWFHPLLWLLHRAARDVREDCCDDLILNRSLTTTAAYCQLLVRIAERIAQRSQRPRLLRCAEQMHPVQARMLRVMDTTLPREPRLSLRGLAAVIVAAGLLLPGMRGIAGGSAEEEQRSKPRGVTESLPEKAVRRDLYGDPLPAGALVRLGTIRYRHNSGSQFPVGDFLSDGTYVSRTLSGRLAYWDLRTGLPDDERPEMDLGDLNLRRFIVLPDGETIVTLGFRFNEQKRVNEYLIQFWEEGQWTKAFRWVEQTGSVEALAATPDGDTIVTGSAQGELKFWDRKTESVQRTYQLPNQFSIESIAFSPDGETLAVAGYRGVYLWEWLAGKEPVSLDGMETGARALMFSPDGQWLATGSDGPIGGRLWDVKSRRLHQTFKGNGQWHYPDRIAFTSDGQFVAVPTRSLTVELWNVSTGRIAHTLETGSFETGSIEPRHVAISPDDRWLVGSDYDPIMVVWDLKTRERLATPPGHRAHVTGIHFTPDGKQVVTASDDRTVRIWNAETGTQERLLQHRYWIRDVAVSPDGKLIASNSLDDTVGLWELDSGKQIYRLFGHGRGGHRAVSFSPEGKRILSWGDNMALRVWDVNTGKALSDFPLRPAGATIPEDENGEAKVGDTKDFYMQIQGSTFTPDGQRFLLAWGQTLSVFDVTTGLETQSLQMEGPLRDVSSASGGHLMATIVTGKPKITDLATGGQRISGSRKQVLQIRSVESGKVRWEITLPEGGFYRRAVFSGDDNLIAVAPAVVGAGIHVFDVESGRLRYRIDGIPAGVSVMAFSPDGLQLASALQDTSALIWDLDEFRVDGE